MIVSCLSYERTWDEIPFIPTITLNRSDLADTMDVWCHWCQTRNKDIP